MQEPLFALTPAPALDAQDSVEVKQLATFRMLPQALQAVPANVTDALSKAANTDVLTAKHELTSEMKLRLERFEADRSNQQLHSELQTQVLISVRALCPICTALGTMGLLPCIQQTVVCGLHCNIYVTNLCTRMVAGQDASTMTAMQLTVNTSTLSSPCG